MTTATATFSWKNDSLAAAKQWIDGTKNLILAAGMSQASDGGQLNTDTLGSPANSNSVYGYHVFRFPDTLFNTAPIYVKATYAVSTYGYPSVNFTVSAGTDSIGNLSSPLLSSGTGVPNNNFQDNVTSYACYVDGTFSVVLGYGIVSANSQTTMNSVACMVVDRARTATGAATGAGFLAESCAGSFISQATSRSIYGGASPNPNGNFVPSLVPSTTAISSAEGPNINVFRHYMMVPGVRPAVGMLTYFNNELGALTPFTATVLGSAHTYLPMGIAMTNWSANPAAAHCCAIRWE